MRRRKNGLHFYYKEGKFNAAVVRECASWIGLMSLAVFLAFALVYFVGLRTSVIGSSMEPTLQNGENVLINRLTYRFFTPKRGDVVVFLPNGNENSHPYIKRLVALPGETEQIRGGSLYVDGVPWEGASDLIADAGIADAELVLGDDEYFVLGDNCNESEDSRSANIGPVKAQTIVGRAWFHFGNGFSGWGPVR